LHRHTGDLFFSKKYLITYAWYLSFTPSWVVTGKTIQCLNNPLAPMLAAIIASVAAPPSTIISFMLKDLVGMRSCQHSFESDTIMVKIREDSKIPPSSAFLCFERNNRYNNKNKTKKAVMCKGYSRGMLGSGGKNFVESVDTKKIPKIHIIKGSQ